MPELPRTNKADRTYLRRFADHEIYVFSDPAKPGAGVSRPALDRLIRDGLVRLGKRVPRRGQPVEITAAGRAVLDAEETRNA